MTDRGAPLTRRALGLSAASALFMTALAAGPAQSERVLDSHPEWLFVTLSAVDAPSGEDTLQTTGFVASGIGGARYRLSPNQTLRRSSDRIQTKDGRWFALDEATPTPEMFGAIGDGRPHAAANYFSNLTALQAIYPFAKSLDEEMDWLGWQAALNHGGGINAHARTYVMCSSKPASLRPLSVVAGRSWGEGFGCKLDYSRFDKASRLAEPKSAPLPCAILLTRDGAGEHYPLYQPLRGLRIVGPGQNKGMIGARWSSEMDIDGNLAVFEQSAFSGFDVGLSFETGAYLTIMYDLLVTDCGTCIEYKGGRNSGENFRFFGGSLSNSGTALANPGGAEFTFFSTALDFNTQCIVQNAGRVELHGVHAEMRLPARAGDPLLECVGGGAIDWFGGMFLGSGAFGAGAEPPVRLTSALCSMRFVGTEIYNLSSRSGLACSGLGVLSAQGWRNRGNPNIGPALLSDARSMDLFGGAGSFEAVQDSPFMATRSAINLPGCIYGQADAPALDRWSSSHLQARVSKEFAHSGVQCLALTKSGEGAGSPDNQLVFFVPVQPGQDVWFSMYWLQPKKLTPAQATAPLFARGFWVQQIGVDALDRPTLSDNTLFTGEHTLPVPLGGSPSWTRWLHNTTFVQSDKNPAGRSGGAPAWASHLAILFDTESLPPLTLYIDDIVANAL